MGMWQTVVDWLGNRTDGEISVNVARDISFDYTSCRFMELARAVMVDYLTSAIQMCEMRFYEHGERVPGRYDAWLWNVSPNPNQSRSAFLTELLERVFITDGECLVVPVRSGSKVRLYIADSYGRQSQPGADDLFTSISVEGSADVCPRPMTMEEVYFFDADSMGAGWRELLSHVAEVYDNMADVVFQATADRNGRKWIMRKDRPANGTPEQQEEIERRIREGLTPFVRSTTGLIVLNKGEELERASLDSGRYSGMNAKDIANIRADMFKIAASCFRMPASMLEGNANNFDQVFESFLTFAVDPVARAISQEVTRKTYTADQWEAGCRASMDTSYIKHIDMLSAAASIEKLVGASVVNPEEVRALMGMDPIGEPWASEYRMTLNHVLAGEVNANDATEL